MDDGRECKCYIRWQSRNNNNKRKVYKNGPGKTKKEGDTVTLPFTSSVTGNSPRTLFKADKSSTRGAWEEINAYWQFKCKLQAR